MRRRILLLAWLLCQTQRDLGSYLKAAGLRASNEEEHAQFRLLNEHLAPRQTPPPLLLPARPRHLQGREAALEQVLNALQQPETQIFALTGMPGVGKSALAREILHRVAASAQKRQRLFPDGIATFTCTGRQGIRGLISLLNEISALFSSEMQLTPGNPAQYAAVSHTAEAEQAGNAPELALALNRARAALANRRALLLLDDLDPAFPLRLACEVLLAQGTEKAQRVILITSQFVPAPTLVSTHLRLRPLSETAALALLGELLGRELSEAEQTPARQACAAVGYLPLAIEGLATAVLANGMSLALASAHLREHPLAALLESETTVVANIEKALANFEGHLRADYLRLANLPPTFDLATAAALFARQRDPENTRPTIESVLTHQRTAPSADHKSSHTPEAHLAGTAATLGQFVRASLLENTSPASDHQLSYQMHPLLYHYARNISTQVP